MTRYNLHAARLYRRHYLVAIHIQPVWDWSRTSAEDHIDSFNSEFPHILWKPKFFIFFSSARLYTERVENSVYYTHCIFKLHFNIISPNVHF